MIAVMGMQKLTAGSGYDYLTRQVARNDAVGQASTPLADYYDEKGEAPGVWLGSGLAGIEGKYALEPELRGDIYSTDGIREIPNTLREASAGLGSRTWKTTLRVVLPAALPGLVSGSMLAVARAAGETAPVLFTIGAINSVAAAKTVTGQSTTLSVQIYNMITNGGSLSTQMAWGAAFTLIAIVLILTTIARAVSARFVMR